MCESTTERFTSALRNLVAAEFHFQQVKDTPDGEEAARQVERADIAAQNAFIDAVNDRIEQEADHVFRRSYDRRPLTDLIDFRGSGGD